MIDAINKNNTKVYYTNDYSQKYLELKNNFGTSGINEPLNDIIGEYGLKKYAMTIKYDSNNVAELILKLLKPHKFKNIIVYVIDVVLC